MKRVSLNCMDTILSGSNQGRTAATSPILIHKILGQTRKNDVTELSGRSRAFLKEYFEETDVQASRWAPYDCIHRDSTVPSTSSPLSRDNYAFELHYEMNGHRCSRRIPNNCPIKESTLQSKGTSTNTCLVRPVRIEFHRK